MNAPPTPPRGDEEEQRKRRKIAEHGGNDFRFGRNFLGELFLRPVRPMERRVDIAPQMVVDPNTRDPQDIQYIDRPGASHREPKRTTVREQTPEPPDPEEMEQVFNQLLYGGNPPPEDDRWSD